MIMSHVHPFKTLLLYFICINRHQAHINQAYAEKSAVFLIILCLKEA